MSRYKHVVYGLGKAINLDGTERPLTAEENARYDKLLKHSIMPDSDPRPDPHADDDETLEPHLDEQVGQPDDEADDSLD